MKKFDISSQAQRKRVLSRLKLGPVSTVELRHQEDILAPAARVHELRHKENFNVKTFWTHADNPGGGSHKIAKYVLCPGVWKKGEKNDLSK